MGQYPTDEELLQMIAEVDDDGSNEIEFSEFLKVIENQKKRDSRWGLQLGVRDVNMDVHDIFDCTGEEVCWGGECGEWGRSLERIWIMLLLFIMI